VRIGDAPAPTGSKGTPGVRSPPPRPRRCDQRSQSCPLDSVEHFEPRAEFAASFVLVHRHIQKIQGPLSLAHAHHRNREVSSWVSQREANLRCTFCLSQCTRLGCAKRGQMSESRKIAAILAGPAGRNLRAGQGLSVGRRLPAGQVAARASGGRPRAAKPQEHRRAGPGLFASSHVTSARFTMTAEHIGAHPEEGALFALEVGVRGRAEHQNVLLSCGGGNHVNLRGLPGGAEGMLHWGRRFVKKYQ
jgi:hypothetical protein